MSVDPKRCVAVVPLIPGPITISAVTGTFTEATSPRWSARATTAQKITVRPTAIKPTSKIETFIRAIVAPIAVPTICPKPSRTDLWSEIRIESVQIIAATTPPFSISKSPTCQAVAPARPATSIWRTQTRRSANSFFIFFYMMWLSLVGAHHFAHACRIICKVSTRKCSANE